jgi:hypothetical protein
MLGYAKVGLPIAFTQVNILTYTRLMSSLFGLDAVVTHETACPLPQMIDDEYLSEEDDGSQPEGRPSLMEALAATVKIFALITEAREANIASFTRPLQMSELTKVLQLNDSLSKIEMDLPDHLKWYCESRTNAPPDSVFRFQAEVVNIRYVLHHHM